MKIAVAYENGEVFQHFGKAEQFKVYTIDGGEVVDAVVISANGGGHDALAAFLADNEIDACICGNIGEGAMAALEEVGIEVVSGAEGDTDAAVGQYLMGLLDSIGCNCGGHCGGDEGCGCGSDEGGCGGCGGGCGGRRIMLEGPNAGKTVRVHYKGTFNDGTQFDSSYDRGETLEFICGAGMMIPGFDKAVVNMTVGQEIDIHLMPEEAYGPSDPRAIFPVALAQLPGAEELKVGERVYLSNAMGQPFPVTVVAKDDTTITFDANHEMAGMELNFHIQLVEVDEA